MSLLRSVCNRGSVFRLICVALALGGILPHRRNHFDCIPPPSPLQIMRKGVLNDLERQTRAIERKTRDAQAATAKGEA
jgi:hypothetical protein